MLRGNLAEAEQLLQEAVLVAHSAGNKWYESQAIRTLSQCQIAKGELGKALELAQEALALGEKIGDRQAIFESHLLLAEALLLKGEQENGAAALQIVVAETKDKPDDLAISGEVYRLQGMLALATGDATTASHCFGRSISVFEMLGDVYRSALAHYWQGRALARGNSVRARTHLQKAIEIFRKLGARLSLAAAEDSLAKVPELSERDESTTTQLSSQMVRLSEATASRKLLLRELGTIILEETTAEKMFIVGTISPGQIEPTVIFAKGWTEIEQASLCNEVTRLTTHEPNKLDRWASDSNLAFLSLHPTKAASAIILVSPRTATDLPTALTIDPLLRVAELGLNTCALHEKESAKTENREPVLLATQGLMPGFIHSSAAMMRVVDEIQKIRSSDVTVLITGESGTGKELVARAIHAHSTRRAKVFVPFNCTAVPKDLSDAFLFGYKRGAFTGAVADSSGVIRAAAGGTLFLDEVGDLPLEIQPKLLRFLQEGEIQPVGEQRPAKVDVRVIAATNSDLEEMVSAGRFREDLYYRLNVIRLHVPPLRERRSEIPSIVSHYIKHYSEKFGRRNIRINSQALDLLMVYDWPGNIRQLTNEIQRLVARLDDGATIHTDLLSPELHRRAVMTTPTAFTIQETDLSPQFWENRTMADAVEQFKRYVLVETLRKNRGNVSRSARELGMTRRGLQLMLVRYGLNSG